MKEQGVSGREASELKRKTFLTDVKKTGGCFRNHQALLNSAVFLCFYRESYWWPVHIPESSVGEQHRKGHSTHFMASNPIFVHSSENCSTSKFYISKNVTSFRICTSGCISKTHTESHNVREPMLKLASVTQSVT